MRRTPRLILLLALLAGTLLVTAITPVPRIHAAPVLDQDYVPPAASTASMEAIVLLGVHVSSAQSFTAALSGPLTQVALLLARNVTEGGGPVVEITAATTGLPTGAVLASAVIPPASLAPFPTPAWVTVPFASPPSVIAGQQYAIILRPPADQQDNWLTAWWAGNPGTYVGGFGSHSISNDPWGPWESGGYDGGFRTYVAVPPPAVTLTLPSPDGANGWFRTSPVLATVTATTTAPSTIAGLTCTVGTLGAISGLGTATATAPLSLTSQGIASGTCSATSPNGDPGISAPFTIMLDSEVPSYSVSLTTADGQPYTPGTQATQPVTATFTCTDATSGVAGWVVSLSFVRIGLDQTATGNCTDFAGNRTTLTVENIDIAKLAGGPAPSPTPTPAPSPTPKPGQPTPAPSTTPTPTPSGSPKPGPATPAPTLPPPVMTPPPKPGQPTPSPAPACHSAQVCGGPTLS